MVLLSFEDLEKIRISPKFRRRSSKIAPAKPMIMDYDIPLGGYLWVEKAAFPKFELFCSRYRKMNKTLFVCL